jgi:hypothetical protein
MTNSSLDPGIGVSWKIFLHFILPINAPAFISDLGCAIQAERFGCIPQQDFSGIFSSGYGKDKDIVSSWESSTVHGYLKERGRFSCLVTIRNSRAFAIDVW